MIHSPPSTELLVLARRLDWRFLLPRPDLGRVAYLGRDDGELQAALTRLADLTTVAVEGDRTTVADRSTFDVVVLSRPTAEECASAMSLLRPGGWLYAEIDSRFGMRKGPRRSVRSLPAAVRTLRELGFTEIAAFWHWPDFATCTHIVPLGDRATVRPPLVHRRPGRVRTALSDRALRPHQVAGVRRPRATASRVHPAH